MKGMLSKTRILIIANVLVVVTVLTVALLLIPNGAPSSSLADSRAHREMMGVENRQDVPRRTAADRRTVEPRINDGIKEFTLTAETVRWEYSSGKTISAWGYNGQVPGPEMRVTKGDKVRVTLTNKLPKATSLHWHGVDVPYQMDGVPGVTQQAIQPGETFTYEFDATPAGTRFYHTHGSAHADEAQQMDMGLSGAFIIEPQGYEPADKEYTLLLDDWQLGEGGFNKAMRPMSGDNHAVGMDYNLFTINGLAAPSTEPLKVAKDDRVRIRLINASSSTAHPMHLHGQQFKVVAEDGNELPPGLQRLRNTITLNPGETYDIELTATNPGVWAFHCHELHHAGMGMVTLLAYDGYEIAVPTRSPSENGHHEDGMSGH